MNRYVCHVPTVAAHTTRKVLSLLSVLFVLGCGDPHDIRPSVEVDSRPSAEVTEEVIENLIDDLAISSDPTDDVGDRRARAYAAAEALHALGKQAFPHLLEHLDDNRESVEFQRLNRRQYVGEACYCIIAYQILDVPPDFAMSIFRTGADGKSHERPYSSAEQDLFDSSTIAAWLKQREAEPLVALQVEALEWLLEEENKIGYPDSKSKSEIHDPLARHLESMKADLRVKKDMPRTDGPIRQLNEE